MDEFLDKQYVLVSTENFEEYLAFIDIGYMARKLAVKLKPIQSLRKNEDGTYTFSFKSMLVNYDITFVPGEEFEEKKPDGIKTQSIITFEGNKLIHIQKESNGRTSKHVRQFFHDKLITTTTAEGLNKTATRIFELVQ